MQKDFKFFFEELHHGDLNTERDKRQFGPDAKKERETGVVKWFDSSKGYGFIEVAQGGEIFVHHSEIRTEGYRSLQEGQKVEFNVVRKQEGLQAHDLVILKKQE